MVHVKFYREWTGYTKTVACERFVNTLYFISEVDSLLKFIKYIILKELMPQLSYVKRVNYS